MDTSTKIAPESDMNTDRESATQNDQTKGQSEMKKAKKKKIGGGKKKLIMNIAQTKYYVVRYVAKNIFKMKLTHSDEEDWDICWMDGAVSCEKLYKMKPYQRINHFPGMYALARKNHLARNLGKM